MNDSTRPFSKGKYRFVGFLVLGLLLIFSPAVYSSAPTFWVSPSGDDGSPGTKMRPFRTLERARDAVRALQESQGQQGAVVYLRDGTYRLGQTFVLDWRDSGQNGYEVVYRAAPGEHPVICGSIQVENWSLYDQDLRIYRAYVGQLKSRQLYVNGQRAIRAQTEPYPARFLPAYFEIFGIPFKGALSSYPPS